MNLIAVGQTVWAYMEIGEKKWADRIQSLKSLKVIGTNTDLPGTYDFLLTFYSNYGLVLYRFQDM